MGRLAVSGADSGDWGPGFGKPSGKHNAAREVTILGRTHLLGWNSVCHACRSDCHSLPLQQHPAADSA